MKILFLDIDGVLNSHNAWIERNRDREQNVLREIYECHTNVLNWVIRETGCKIVISSTWRLHFETKDFDLMLGLFGVPFRTVIGQTRREHDDRGAQIKWWLDVSPDKKDIESFAIIDDDTCDIFGYGFDDKIVTTSHDTGLTFIEGKKLIEILGENNESIG